MASLLTKNQIIDVTVDALSHEGSGIARHEGMAVFIPSTAIGDRLKARVVKVGKSYAFAIVQELLEASPHRVENDCPVYTRCGGCQLRHISYSHEMEVKEDWVRQNMLRIGGVQPVYDPAIPSPACGRYRNKAQYPVRQLDGKIRMGFFAERSHALIPIGDCLLQPAFFRDICGAVTRYMEECGVSAYEEEAHTGLVRHLYIRWGEKTGQVMVCLVVNGDGIPRKQKLLELLAAACPGQLSVVLSHNRERTNVILGGRVSLLQGEGAILDELCGVTVPISPHSFYQVNRRAAELLYRAALEYADPGPEDVLLDLYCGAGTIGLSMAHRAGEVIGVELAESAVRDARRAAKQNSIANARFICGDAAQAAKKLEGERLRPSIVILDPPRKGADGALLEAVVTMAPGKIVYISCNSATLARDCKALEAGGYRTVRARAVDLFPRTAHVETVALLLRVKESEKIAVTMDAGLDDTEKVSDQSIKFI